MNFTNSSYGETLLNNRLIAIIFLLLITVGMSFGAKNLYFDNDYRAFFGKTNPQLDAFERLQKTYTKIDNVQFAVEPKPGSNASSIQILTAILISYWGLLWFGSTGDPYSLSDNVIRRFDIIILSLIHI